MKMATTEDAKDFEKGRIRALQEERLHIQKKTFTKWMNSFLQKAKMEVEDLFTDLGDGRKLLKLLEIISGEKLGKPNQGKMRVHRIENVNKSLAFLHTKVRLENIGAEDIVDGNPRMILGLIWTIILRFQIQEIEINVDEEDEREGSVKKSAKEALLLWCQRKTNGYQNVDIQNFSSSWQTGLGFNALIHHHRPDLINFNSLRPDDHLQNLRNAFDVAEKHLGIPRLLDPEDIDTARPDEKSVITYVASYYHTFSKMKAGATGGKRIGNIISKIRDIESQQNRFETYSTELLVWIRGKIVEIRKRDFPNSLDGIQMYFKKFKDYRMIEKPPKYQEKVEVEANYFDIQIKLQQLRQPPYVAPEGQRPHDIEQAWQELEKQEYLREVALKEELLRQERLEQLAYKFERKSVLREGYLNEMIQVLSDPRYGSNLNQVLASVKKHEAISADILSRKDRFLDLKSMCVQLEKENYHAKLEITAREKQIMERWQELLDLLKIHKDKLERSNAVINLEREIDTLTLTIQLLQADMSSDAGVLHLLDVQEKLQKFTLQESQVNAMAETIRKVQKQGKLLDSTPDTPGSTPVRPIQDKLQELDTNYKNLLEMSRKRQSYLEDCHAFYQLVQDLEEEGQWVDEKLSVCTATIQAKDLRALTSLQQKHKGLLDEMERRYSRFTTGPMSSAEEMIAAGHPDHQQLQQRCQATAAKWKALQTEAAKRRATLDSSTEAYVFFSDCNETDSVIKECTTIAKSKDFGQDKLTALSLLQRHRQLNDKIQSIAVDVRRVEENGAKLKNSQISEEALYISADPSKQQTSPERMVPVEVWEDEPFERTEIQKVIEDRKVPQVKALYPYTGHGIDVKKGETMFLLDKTNADWWNIRKANGENGFVPANYVKEVEPKVVAVEVKKAVVVKDTRKVKKVQYVKEAVQSNAQKSGKEIINERQKAIVDSYSVLQNLSKERQLVLQNSLQLFDYYGECEDFGKWMKDKKKVISTKEIDVGKATKTFEKFLTDFSSHKQRLASIDIACRELEIIFPDLKNDIVSKQKETHRTYDGLVKLKEEQEKNLEGSASVIFFQKSCEDVCDWITEKSEKLELDDLAKDLTTVKALQRKHKGIERELAPIKDKVGQVTQLGRDVLLSFPDERENIEERTSQVQAKWEMLESRAAERSRRLEDAVGNQLFNNGVKQILAWVDNTKSNLNTNENVRDVQTAEELLNQHAEIGDDIRANQDEFVQLISLGEKMYSRQPSQDTQDKINTLGEERKAVLRGWQEKGDWLRQVRDLQLFNREADHIEAATSAQAKFLDTLDGGEGGEDVESVIKRHDDFSATLSAQEERMKGFMETAHRLLEAGHPDSASIQEKIERIEAGRGRLKEKMGQKRGVLEEGKLFQEFRTQVQEMKDFISDKKRLVREDSFKDGIGNLGAKTKKQEVLEGEIKANSGQLKVLNRTGQQMVNRNHYKKDQISKDLDSVNKSWEELVEAVRDQGNRLGQAKAQKDYNMVTSDMRTKLEDINNMIKSEDVGEDKRYCKTLLSQHLAAEQELDQVEAKVNGLNNLAQELAEGHFDGPNIVRTCSELSSAVANLKSPAKARREALNQSMKFHEFNFDLSRELEWIAEKKTILASSPEIQGLQHAQSAVKKHKKLEEEIINHCVVIDKVVESGQTLLDGPAFPSSKEVIANTRRLQEAWKELQEGAQKKKDQLQVALKAQQFFFEVAEIETWMGEKAQTLKSSEYGKDEDSAVKLLTKHKGLELEIDTYSGIIQEISNSASQLLNSGHPESKLIKSREEILARDLRALKKEAKDRRDKLVQSIQLHEYTRESREVKEYIKQQMNTAKSQDLGQDYEHLEILLARFQEFKLRVQSGEDKFRGCESLARRLENLQTTVDVKGIQTDLSESWYELIQAIEHRDEKLESAGEIHRFNRDIGEALSRIQEKSAILQTQDLGRDTKSVQSLIRKHEGFENDLVALEAQLQVIIDDAAALQTKYPGENAAHIKQQQSNMLAAWTELQKKAAARKVALLSSNDYFTFMGMSRDLLAWSSSLRRSLITEEKVSDAASAQMLKAEHDDLKAEIETREKTFSEVVALGETMVEHQHRASPEVQEKITAVLTERQKLHTAWQHKKVYLDQLIDIHFYLRDAKQILSTSTSQEMALSNTDCGTTVEEVEAHLKTHEAFQNLVAQQEEKVSSLKEHAEKLVRQKHFDTATIQDKLAEILTVRSAVGELCTHKSNLLNLNYLYAKFIQETGEEMSWIEEKKRKLESNNKTADESNLTEKIKLLQKHQALQAEIERHKPQITEVCTKGNRLVQKRHENSPSINQNLNQLSKCWEELQLQSNLVSKGLDEARGILEFRNEVGKIESWIRDKELLVSQGDLGKDFEHCLELQKKLDDVDGDMRVDESRIAEIFGMADRLAAEAGTEAGGVLEKRSEIQNKWKNLQGSIQTYREHLSIAGNIHAFQRDTDETLARIKEKLVLVDMEDQGKDLKDVQELIKRTESVVEYMTGLEKRIKDHEVVSKQLITKYPDMTNSVAEKMENLNAAWQKTNQRIVEREAELGNSQQFHQFVHDCKEHQTWLLNMDTKLKAVGVPSSASEADAFLSLHQERKSELSARKEMLEMLRKHGENLLEEKHSESEKIQSEMEKTLEIQENVAQSWDRTKLLLLQGNQLHAFKLQHQRALGWLEEKEAVLNNDDLGDSLAAVEALTRKHEGFITTLNKQAEVVEDLERKGGELVSEDHYDADKVKELLENIRTRLEYIKEKGETRIKKLNASRQLQQFLRKVFDIKTWVKEKVQVALDESYLDLSNLVNKIQKHSSFEAEIAANKPRLASIKTEGQALCQESHFASIEIASQLEDLQSEWTHLIETSSLKKTRLHEANSALIYLHSIDEFEVWLEEVETGLESEDHGKDMNSVSKLLKKLSTIEGEVLKRKDTLQALEQQCEKFGANKHFMITELESKFARVQSRYELLQEPLQIRRENLEDSSLLHQFNREVADETFWLEEKLPLAASTHLGNSLTEVQTLQQKHQVLESEIQSHEKVINLLVTKADQMIRSNHFASDDIKETCEHLKEGYNQLKDLSSLRKLRLTDAVESQQFFFKLYEVVEWIKEKEPILKVKDIKNDEDSVLIYLKKINDILAEMEGYNKKIETIKAMSEKMIERSHFDSANIQTKMADLTDFHVNFKAVLLEQKRSLVDQKAVLEFIHETEEATEWIDSQMMVSASEDYGKDVSHVEILIKSFDTFLQSVQEFEIKINRVAALGQGLLDEENTHSELVQSRLTELTQLWEDLKELSAARHEALNGAKQVHVFDKNADETMSWIGEKEAEMSTEELGQDLESIQSLLERQQGFHRDLDAIKEQVAEVEKEAGVLSELFPDAAAHIDAKREDTRHALNTLIQVATAREGRLKQNQQIQRYFDDYRELMAWSSEVIAKMTSPDLASDLSGAETLISRHKEIRREMDSRLEAFNKFERSGKELVQEGHFMAAEILEKISVLNSRKEKMYEGWQLREELYIQHMDYLSWCKETDAIESWISSREPTVKDVNLGANIDEVEELLKKQRDFEGAILAQEDKLQGVHRITLIEKNFAALREREEAARRQEVILKEQERLDNIKKKELTRITNERRRENERRRTQEIKFNREDFDAMRAVGNGKSSEGSSTVSPANEEVYAFNKRGESMRVGVDPKKAKRTPSFTTRRRTQSFRRHTKNLASVENLPPVEVDGFLDRKQELQAGGKRATMRSWKNYYTVLCGQLMCFFRDQEDFFQSKAGSSPVTIYQAGIEAANDYTKKAFVFRVHATDGSEYLFSAESQEEQEEWVKKLKFHASLSPAKQLTSYKSVEEVQGEPVYANLASSPPLPVSIPPPAGSRESGFGVAGTRDILNKKPGSREPISVVDGRTSIPEYGPPPVYANVDKLRPERSSTLPVHSRSSGGDQDSDTVSVTSSKEKKSSVLGRFLGRKNPK